MENPWKVLSNINPQRERGHRQIENSVYHALMMTDLTAAEYKVILSIINLTWGFKKMSAPISIGRIIKDTTLAERTVKQVIVSLKSRRIIYYQPSAVRSHHGSPPNEYLFNKHFDTWTDKGARVRMHAKQALNRVRNHSQEGCAGVHSVKEKVLKKRIKENKPDSQFDQIPVQVV